MTPGLKAKWIAALRSGNYKQGKNQLQDGDEYCCLGVLCVVAGITITDEGEQANGNSYVPIENLIGDEDVMNTLWKMNDRDERPFDAIADYIEGRL